MPRLRRQVLSQSCQGARITRTSVEMRKAGVVLHLEELRMPNLAGGRWETEASIPLTRSQLSKLVALAGAKAKAR